MTGISRRDAIRSLVAVTAASASLLAVGAAHADGTGVPDKAPGSIPRANGLKAQLAPSDREMNRKCINKTLNEALNGTTWSWKNPKTGNSGTVKPTSPLPRPGAETCRTFDETITLKDGRSEKISGRACKRPDGSWSVA